MKIKTNFLHLMHSDLHFVPRISLRLLTNPNFPHTHKKKREKKTKVSFSFLNLTVYIYTYFGALLESLKFHASEDDALSILFSISSSTSTNDKEGLVEVVVDEREKGEVKE